MSRLDRKKLYSYLATLRIIGYLVWLTLITSLLCLILYNLGFGFLTALSIYYYSLPVFSPGEAFLLLIVEFGLTYGLPTMLDSL